MDLVNYYIKNCKRFFIHVFLQLFVMSAVTGQEDAVSV